jgi:hypothetical protein
MITARTANPSRINVVLMGASSEEAIRLVG